MMATRVSKADFGLSVLLGIYAVFNAASVFGSPCERVPKPCEEQTMSAVHYKALQTKGWAYYCTGDYRFYYDNDNVLGFGNNWKRSPSCFSVVEQSASTAHPSKAQFSITNWCHHSSFPFAPKDDDITVTLGCSKIPPGVNPSCDNPTQINHDPGCPLQGHETNTCSQYGIACIQTYTEKCTDGTEYYCTRDIDVGVISCLYCP